MDQVLFFWIWEKTITRFYQGKGVYFGFGRLVAWVYRYLLLVFREPHGLTDLERIQELAKIKRKLFFLNLFPLMFQKLVDASRHLLAKSAGDDALLAPVKQLGDKQKQRLFEQVLYVTLVYAKDDDVLVLKRLEYLAQGIVLSPRSYKQAIVRSLSTGKKKQSARNFPSPIVEQSLDRYADKWFSGLSAL